MKKDIQTILQELYEIDGSLKEKENELTQFISQLLEASPEVKIDDNFKSALKSQIEEHILQQKISQYQNQPTKVSLGNIFAYIFGSVGVLAFVFVFGIGYIFPANTPNKDTRHTASFENDAPLLAFNNTITPAPASFGSLSNIQAGAIGSGGMGGVESDFDTTKSLLSLTPMTIDTTDGQDFYQTSMERDADMWDDDMYYPYEINRYAFDGEFNFEIPSQLPVYKRTLGNNNIFLSQINNANFLGVDLSTFQNTSLSSVNLLQNIAYGYSIYIDYIGETLSIYKNWRTWPTNNYNATATTTLDKTETINLANTFLKEHNISLLGYGEPEIISGYDVQIMKSGGKETIQINSPYTTVSVLYPLVVDNNLIHQEYGNKAGITIEIDPNTKKISGANGFQSNNYEKYNYSIENNIENILTVANVGGRYGFYEPEDNAIIREVKIKNPQLTYLYTYRYSSNHNDDMYDEEYLVPAIVFQVDTPDDLSPYSWVPETVAVPLLKDFYEYGKTGTIIGPMWDL